MSRTYPKNYYKKLKKTDKFMAVVLPKLEELGEVEFFTSKGVVWLSDYAEGVLDGIDFMLNTEFKYEYKGGNK